MQASEYALGYMEAGQGVAAGKVGAGQGIAAGKGSRRAQGVGFRQGRCHAF